MEISEIREFHQQLQEQVGGLVYGQQKAVDLLSVALLSQGHVLMEGPPGVAKTFLARTFAASLGLRYSRVQFTPDLMPGDVTGTNVFDFKASAFTFIPGPVFTDVLLGDEINRAPPKTQAALLEAMQERAVTLDGKTHSLGDGFMVIATQNPLESEGTYPLPEAQLDRFLFKIEVSYPDEQAERHMVRQYGNQAITTRVEDLQLERLVDLDGIRAARGTLADIHISDPIVDYVVELVRRTRGHPSVAFGASPRSANMLASASRALAIVRGMDYVIPDLVKELAKPALAHRIVMSPSAFLDGRTSGDVLKELLEQVPVPR